MKLGQPLGFTDEVSKGGLRNQNAFIVSLELPTYHNFTNYSYYDILKQLALRLMVKDSVKRERAARRDKELEHKIKLNCGVEDVITEEDEVEQHLKSLSFEEECIESMSKLLSEFKALYISDQVSEILILREIIRMTIKISEERDDSK